MGSSCLELSDAEEKLEVEEPWLMESMEHGGACTDTYSPARVGVRARQRLVANRAEERSPAVLPLKTSASSPRTDGGLP